MTEPVLRFRANCRPSIVEGDAVYLHSEAAPAVRLTGTLAARLAEEVGTGRARTEVLDRLAEDFGERTVHDALDKLVEAGFVVEADPGQDSSAAGYWESMGLSASAVSETLSAHPIEVRTAGEIDPQQFVTAAERIGLRITASDAALTVMLTDDYLRPEVGEFNVEAVAAGRPWFLCRPVGTTLWLGPRYSPGSSACHACLTSRLSRKDPVAAYLRSNAAPRGAVLGAAAWLPAAAEVGFRLAAIEVARWIAGSGGGQAVPAPECAIEVRTLDTLDLRLHRHPLKARPQCPVCGSPSRQADRAARPVRLASDRAAGGRGESPERFVARTQHLVSPVTGVLSRLERVLAEDGAHMYLADQNFAMPMSSRDDLRTVLRSVSAGKGRTDDEAKASALGEAIERYSGMFHGDEPRVVASFEELGEQAIHPNDVHLYSERQIVRRTEHNARGIRSQAVDEPLNPLARLEWTPVWSMTRGCRRHLPTSILYYGYAGDGQLYRGHANSNGCAAGATLEDAVLRGFLELVERDAVAVWWYNRVRRPAVDLDSFEEPEFSRWRAIHAERGRRVAVLDITNDLGVPVMAAVSWRTGGESEIAMGFGAHFDVRTALERAMSESNQFLHAAAPVRPGGGRPVGDPLQEEWLRSATLRTEPHLVPASVPMRTAAEFPASAGGVPGWVRQAQRVVEERGLEMLVLDQTRLDVGVPVARVIVPGLRHFWPRFAPGRLYDVPVALGWLDAPTPERCLNPQPMFL